MSTSARAVIAPGLAKFLAAFLAVFLVGFVAACSSEGLAPEDTPDGGDTIDAPATLDGHNVADAAGQDAAPVVATAYRLSAVTLQDPHVFVDFLGGCFDATDQVNSAISDKLNKDADSDGNLDYSLVMLFEPLDQKPGDMPTGSFVTATCKAPATSTTCSGAGAMRTSATVSNLGTGTCLAPVAGTTTQSYTPAILTPSSPCFSSAATAYTFTAAGATITLAAAQIGAAYTGSPATSLTHGLMRGFLSEADADKITVDLSAIGSGMVPLGSLFAGGNGSCVTDHSDKDVGPNGVPGWYLYFNFTALKVAYSE